MSPKPAIAEKTRVTYRVDGCSKIFVSAFAAYRVLARKLVLHAFKEKYGAQFTSDPLKDGNEVPKYLAAWSLTYSDYKGGLGDCLAAWSLTYSDYKGGLGDYCDWHFDTSAWRKDQNAIAKLLRAGLDADALISEIVERPLKDHLETADVLRQVNI